MKLNLDFYKEKKEDLLPIEKEIIKYINENDENNFSKIIREDTRKEVILALSPIRENILNWYNFKENATILEIGANFGEITGLLCDRASKVVSIEDSLQKAKAIEKRHYNRNNLEVIVSDIKDIQLQEKYDYIVIIGTLEEVSKEVAQNCICKLKKYLKDKGRIIFATDNEMGMQLFAKTDSTGINITNLNGKNLYTLDKIRELIQKNNLVENKVYYPMPDYKLPNVIYTNEKPLSKNNLSRNVTYNTDDTIKFYQENEAFRNVLKDNNDIFKLFVNSYLIEISLEKLEEDDIKLVAFSNMRKPEYRIKTIIENEKVYKYALNEKSKQHIEGIKKNIDIIKETGLKTVDEYENNRIVSKYTNAPTLDEVIIKLIKQGKKEEAISLMKRFKEEINSKLEEVDSKNNVLDKYEIEYEKTEIEKMKFIKYGLWDLIFQNCFYVENQFFFYDQEWIEENIPFDFIIYRAIKYFTRIKKYISNEELNSIMGLNEQEIQIFDKLDNKIQEKIKDEIVWKVNTRGLEMIDIKRKELTANHQINLLEIENSENKGTIAQKNAEIEQLKNELNYIINSVSWKITKPLRLMLKMKRKNEK